MGERPVIIDLFGIDSPVVLVCQAGRPGQQKWLVGWQVGQAIRSDGRSASLTLAM